MAAPTERLPEMGAIEVFQQLHIGAEPSEQPAIRRRLIDATHAPWKHEEDADGDSFGVTLFSHSGNDDSLNAKLMLARCDDGFKVININSCNVCEFGIHEYNNVLQNFLQNVVLPALDEKQYKIDLSKSMQNPSDWLGKDVAMALFEFSRLADKRTGYARPDDWNRWTEFLFISHDMNNVEFPYKLLERWLHESEDWDEDMSCRLSTDYEVCVGLLNDYDVHLSKRKSS